MKLKTTAILAVCGIVASSAAAFAIPVKPTVGVDPTALLAHADGDVGTKKATGARVSAGDTLLVDARLGHASLSQGSAGETYLFAQVTAGEDKAGPAAATPMNLGVAAAGPALSSPAVTCAKR